MLKLWKEMVGNAGLLWKIAEFAVEKSKIKAVLLESFLKNPLYKKRGYTILLMDLKVLVYCCTVSQMIGEE